jgi:hypothetical protein
MATEQENTLWLVAGAVAIYLAYTGKLSSLLGLGPDGNKSAAGTPPRPRTQAAPDLVGAVGAGACIAGGTAAGMPALGILASPVCSKVAHYVADGLSWAYHGLGGGSSKVGRAKNNKDVFPNDMAECAKRGITTVDACGALWDGVKWPWQAFPHQGDVAVYPPASKPPAGKPPGW